MKRLLAALMVAVALATARAASQPAPPVRVAVLVDNGFLVGAAVNSIRQGLQVLVDGLPSSDEILLATIAGQMRIRQAPTTDRKKLRDAIGTIFVDQRSGTKLVDSVMEVDERFLKKANLAAGFIVIVTTDGPETSGDRTEEVNRWIREIVQRGVVVHAILLSHLEGRGNEPQICMALTRSTGGRYQSIGAITALPDTLGAIASVIGQHPPR